MGAHLNVLLEGVKDGDTALGEFHLRLKVHLSNVARVSQADVGCDGRVVRDLLSD